MITPPPYRNRVLRGAACLLLASVAAAFTTACSSSPDNQIVKELQLSERSGQLHSLYSKSKEIVDNPENYSPSTVAKAEQYFESSRKVLTKHYQSSVSTMISSGRFDKAVVAYEESEPEIRETLERNFPLQHQLFRTYIEENSFFKANDALEAMSLHAGTENERDLVKGIEPKFEELKNTFDTLNAYRNQIREAANQFGFMVDNTGVPSTHCSGTSQEDIIPESIQELITTYKELNDTFGELKQQLGQPGQVRASDVIAASVVDN